MAYSTERPKLTAPQKRILIFFLLCVGIGNILVFTNVVRSKLQHESRTEGKNQPSSHEIKEPG